MQAGVTFDKALEALGAYDGRELETGKNWSFYTVKYRTPAGNMPANYLCLAHDCPLNEATSKNLSTWKSLSGSRGYTVAVTTKSRLAYDLKKTADNFGGKEATTPRNLLFEHVMREFIPSDDKFEEFKYFVEPDVAFQDGRARPALSYLSEALATDDSKPNTKACAVILAAPAGLGKTTLCRMVAKKLVSQNKQAIPILIESAQWQNIIKLTLPNVLNAALLQLVPDAVKLTNEKIFRLLIQEQLIVPIFDGFDELCLHPNSNYSPTGLITELLELMGDAGARILITARETFWTKYSVGVPTERIEQINLQGFSNDQRKRFFLKRLNDPSERDIANRLVREVGVRLYEGDVPQEESQRDRASGVPLLLELVALYVSGNPSATFVPDTMDPLGPLLRAVCERENVRQQLQINAETQMSIFEEIFRDFPGDFTRKDLREYVELEVPGISEDKLTRFESHAFLAPANDLKPRFETLRVYFVAKWLATKLEQSVSGAIDKETTQILDQNASGNSDVFDHLVRQFKEMGVGRSRAAISHAFKMIRSNKVGWEGPCSALFHLTQRLVATQKIDKKERFLEMFSALGLQRSSPFVFPKIAVVGQIYGLDLTGVIFDSCVFRDVEFKNCTFHETTNFNGGRFEGSLTFENCEHPGRATIDGSELSDAARIAWDKQKGRAVKAVINEDIAREALRDILRRFVGQYGFSTIKEIDRVSGAVAKNPCFDSAWEELLRANIVQRHGISGVSGGGLHVDENSETRHEVRNFLDNAALGQKLKKVLQRLVS